MPNLGQNRLLFVLCELEVWQITLKNNRTPRLICFKLFTSFHSHRSIQTGVTVRKHQIWDKSAIFVWKRLNWIFTIVAITFDLWPWTFAWTSLLSMEKKTPEDFMMIRWWEHSEKGVRDRQTDERTNWTIHRVAWSQLKLRPIVQTLHEWY